MSCVFCNIVKKEIPSSIVFESDNILAFHDISPQAPIHIVVITKEHYSSSKELSAKKPHLVTTLFTSILEIVTRLRLNKGYRVVTNIGEDGGQTVDHVHFHILGGRQLNWPPG